MRDEEPDDELGRLLGSTLRTYADEAPQAHHGELAATARKRVRGRRRALVGTAAAVVAFAGIGGVWSALDDDLGADTAASGAAAGEADTGNREAQDPGLPRSGDLSTLADRGGIRSVTYRGVQVSVPENWTTGVTNWPWCLSRTVPQFADAGQTQGEVGLPGSIPYLACRPVRTPVSKLGVHVWLSRTTEKPGRRTEQLGDGWVRDTVVINGVAVEVQTRNAPELRRSLLAAIRVV